MVSKWLPCLRLSQFHITALKGKKQEASKACGGHEYVGGGVPSCLSAFTKEEKSFLSTEKTPFLISLDKTGLCGCPAAKEGKRA